MISYVYSIFSSQSFISIDLLSCVRDTQNFRLNGVNLDWTPLPLVLAGFERLQMGVWQRVFEILVKDADNSTIIRARQHSADAKKSGQDAKNSQCEEAIGRSCGGSSSKIHAAADASGNPVGFY